MFHFNDKLEHDIELINNQGQSIGNYLVSNESKMDLARFANGMYFFKTEIDGATLIQKAVRL